MTWRIRISMTVCEPRRIDIGRMGTRSAKKGRQTFTLPEYTSQYRYANMPVNIGKCITNRPAAQRRRNDAFQARDNHRNLAPAGSLRLPESGRPAGRPRRAECHRFCLPRATGDRRWVRTGFYRQRSMEPRESDESAFYTIHRATAPNAYNEGFCRWRSDDSPRPAPRRGSPRRRRTGASSPASRRDR